jgi:hypothetical protein
VLLEALDPELIGKRQHDGAIEVSPLRVRLKSKHQVAAAPGDVAKLTMAHQTRVRSASTNLVHQQRGHGLKKADCFRPRQVNRVGLSAAVFLETIDSQRERRILSPLTVARN